MFAATRGTGQAIAAAPPASPGTRSLFSRSPRASLFADADRIRHVLVILLDNAARYAEKGKRIDVWFKHRQSEGVFFVADDGPGIPEADRTRVFERFCQVEDTLHHSGPGQGLRLYIAGRIVDAHGGWIAVSTLDGGGSVSSFGIPSGVF